MARQAYELAKQQRFGSPGLWRAVVCSQAWRRSLQPPASCRRHRARTRPCRARRSIDARSATCLAAIASHRTTSGSQSRSDDPSPRPSAARASRALRRRLQGLAGKFEKGGASFDHGIVPKTGTMLVRQWRGHTHTVLVREDGFEYEGQHHRSLTVIAERITGAHWSGPRFFGLTKRAGILAGAGAGR